MDPKVVLQIGDRKQYVVQMAGTGWKGWYISGTFVRIQFKVDLGSKDGGVVRAFASHQCGQCQCSAKQSD